jgi:hypothetical protein
MKNVLISVITLVVGLGAFIGIGSWAGFVDIPLFRSSITSEADTALIGPPVPVQLFLSANSANIDWSHVDLLRRFQKKGLNFKAIPDPTSKFVNLLLGGSGTKGDQMWYAIEGSKEKHLLWVCRLFEPGETYGVHKQGFTWGRFHILSDQQSTLQLVSAALDNKYNQELAFVNGKFPVDASPIFEGYYLFDSRGRFSVRSW